MQPIPVPVPTVGGLVHAMERIAPLGLAEPWDNVGLLVGDAGAALRGPVLLAIDLTDAVLEEAEGAGAGAVVAYHPPIFHAMKRLTAAEPGSRRILRAARAGIAIYSPHTALDAAPGALCDWLADTLLAGHAGSGADRRALRPSTAGSEEEVKLVTFVPEAEAARVREALASAGAGRIGRYSLCSFAVRGTGTFLGAPEETHPAVGQPGRLEAVEELRLEMVCPRRALPLALQTLRHFHPYEEPAIDAYPLEPRPERGQGPGRRLVLDQPATARELARRVKGALKLPHVEAAIASERPVSTVGVCAGAGASLLEAAAAEGCEVYLTGEMKHHEVLAATGLGMSVILAGHTRTERGYLPRLAGRLATELPGLDVRVSAADTDPLLAL